MGLSLRVPQNIMAAKPSQHADFPLHLEGEAVSLGDPSLPNVSRILHFFYLEGGVTLVVQKKLQLLINRLLQLVR